MSNNLVEIIYQKRKTIGMYITNDAKIEVRCPFGTPKKTADEFIEKNLARLLPALERKRRVNAEKAAFRIGGLARLLGKVYPVKYLPGQKYGFNNECFYLPEGISSDAAKEAMICIYKSIARNVIVPRAAEIAAALGRRVSGIRITSAKTRWGSCSGKNSVNFSWRLVMASRAAIDYVIVHELAHTIEHNHGKDFWNLVGRAAPDYKKSEKELEELAALLECEDW